MRAKIHRGAHEIGGNCVELEAEGKRLVLDLGWPLTVPRDADLPAPDVAGLTQPDPSLLGIVLSHPHLDHSAFDSYCLLVEAEGRRLFYTGDLRAHGRKHGTFEDLLRDPPTNIDVLLMEGTNIHPGGGALDRGLSETDVEHACVETFRATEGIVLACFSPQNIDRLVTIYRPALGIAEQPWP